MDNKKQVFTSFGFKIFLLMLITIVVAGTATYAFFVTEKNQSGISSLKSSCFNIAFTDKNSINLTGAYSMDNEKGQTLEPYTFTIKNTCNIEAAYSVLLNTKAGSFSSDHINFSLNGGNAKKLSLNSQNTKNIPSGYDKSYILERGTLAKGESATYDVRLWINAETEYEDVQGMTWEGEVRVVSTVDALEQCPRSSQYTTITLANGLKVYDESATTYNECNATEMYTFDHEISSTDADGNVHTASQIESWTKEERRDYRYIGKTPNNWIKFNDEDWRIIGVFTVEKKVEGSEATEKKQLIKIIRNESIGGIPWDDYTDGNLTNEWSTSSLKTLLNGDYYNTGSSFSYTYKTYSSSTETAKTIPKGLTEKARSQIEEVKWYLGGSSTYQNLGGPDYYAFERGTTTCATTGNCSGQTRTTNINQRVGLMYPSDYIYTYDYGVDETCYTDGYNCKTTNGGTPSAGWLFNSSNQWTQSPNATNLSKAFNVGSSSYDDYYYIVNNQNRVRPAVYLKSNIKIIDGDGSSSATAYILE